MKTQKFNLSRLVLFIIVVGIFRPVWAQDSYEQILKKYKIDPQHVSLEIVSEDKSILAINSSEKKIPASVTKLLTTYAVMNRFPLGHKFLTQVYKDNETLYVKGGGDPGFVSENMWYMVNELTRHQLGTLKEIIVDDSLFDRVRFDQSREDKRVDRAYDSPVGALSFNWNAVNIFIKPTKAGEKAQVIVDPENQLYEVRNNTMTVSGAVKKELVVSINNDSKVVSVSGEVHGKAPEKPVYKSISDPDLWTGINLKAFLKQRGIQVLGEVKKGQVPDSAKLIYSHESKNLSLILADMNKFSNNYVAEMLTKALPTTEGQTKNISLKDGVKIMRDDLLKLGLKENEFFIENPSGFTRNNLISAKALNKVLLKLKTEFLFFPATLESLPIAGIDGTLKKRMKDTPAQGRVRGKTGYLDGVVSLAGYAGRKDGHILTYSFLYNGPRDESIVREAFDQILLLSLK